MATYDEIFEVVKEMIHERFGTDKKIIVPAARFHEDLGINSLESAELYFELEERFELAIEDNVDTVGELVCAIISCENEQELG